MTPNKHSRSDSSSAGRNRRTVEDESGLSFEAEPTGLEESEQDSRAAETDPGASSGRAAFTPGPPSAGHSPFFTPATGIALALLIVLLAAAFWFL